MKTTWTYGMKTITVDRGCVVESTGGGLSVGTLVTAGQLRACGWVKAKKPVQYDAWGRKFRDGDIERK
jgi:hypothetical protein